MMTFKEAAGACCEAASSGKEVASVLRLGLPGLDNSRSLRIGEVTLLAGAGSSGKTSLAIHAAIRGCAADLRVTLVSYEAASEAMLAASVCDRLAGGRVGDMGRGLLSPSQWAALTKGIVAPAERLALVVEPSRDIDGLAEILPEAPDQLIVIDAVQAIPGTLRAASRDQQLGDVARGLKQLAVERTAAVLVTSHVNRDARGRYDVTPRLSDIRDCGLLVDLADSVWLLAPEDEGGDGSVRLVVAKARSGRCLTTRLRFEAGVPRDSDGDPQ